MIKISIIVPVFNVEKYLDRCITNIINQSYSNIEIIIINDGSTDNSLDICNKYKKIDNRIIVINQENQGLSAVRNKGIDIATGEYILFVDSDDILNVDLLKNIESLLNKENDVICFQHSINDSMEYTYLDIEDKLKLSGEDFLELLYEKNKMFCVVWKYCYRKEFLDENKLKFHEGIIYEDEEWNTIMLCKAKSVIFRDFVGYNYFIREGSITTSNKNINSYLSKIKVAININKFIRENEIKNKRLLKKIKQKIYSFFVKNSIYILKYSDNYDEVNLIINNIKVIKNCSSIKQFILGIIFIFYILKMEVVRIYKKF